MALPGLPQPGNPLTFTNSSGVRVLGIELLAGGSFGLNDSLFANLTLPGPEGPRERRAGARSARRLFSLRDHLEIRGRVRVTPEPVARSSRPRAAGDDSRAKVAGLRALRRHRPQQAPGRTLELGLSLDNLFGKSYTDPAFKNGVPGDYPRPGRRVLLHASYKF